MEKLSQLVEVIGPCNVDIFANLNLRAFGNRRNTKNDDRNILTETSLSAYSMGGCKKTLGAKA